SSPCHITVSREGKCLLGANYGGGSVFVLPIGPDGRLGERTAFVQHKGRSVHPRRQAAPHAHSINLDAAGRFAFAADLGLDKVLVYRFDAAKGTLVPHDPAFAATAPGAGPRHFAMHPCGKWAYVINELNSTVTAFAYDAAKGALTAMQTISTLPDGFTGANSCAEVQVHPSGKFLYGSNRGHESIAIFTIEAGTGRLRSLGQEPTQGKHPRNFSIDPTGTYLLAANRDTGNVVVFGIDGGTGALKATGHTVKAPGPSCVKMMPAD
ncbi:MAG: lactonase family protein, partial [Phycisphaerae bacterium]